MQRRDGQREWKDYTPYEWRNVAAFVRLGWRERAWDVVRYFFDDRAPRGWNQWAEVVSRTPRTPFFLGDLPHAWVASDFLRSALDMFAYTRERDDSLVLAAGVPVAWLDGEGIAVEGLYTPHGRLGYSLRSDGGELRLDVAADAGLPVSEYGPNEAKIAVTGMGNADKAQVRRALERVHGLTSVPSQADAADAVAVALTHLMDSRMRDLARSGSR